MLKNFAGQNEGWREDERIDKRIRDYFMPYQFNINGDFEKMVALLESDALGGGEALAPSDGLEISTKEIISAPDGNTIKLSVMNPKGRKTKVNCVVYIHGGGMSKFSCFYKNYQTFGRLIANEGVLVVLPEFRNSVVPSEEGAETAKFPGGLNDCLSTIKYIHENRSELNIGHIVVAGESGGGNLTIATALSLLKEGNSSLIAGFYSLCPYLTGIYPSKEYPSSVENAGIFLDYPIDGEPITVVKYQKEGDDLHGQKNALAWPNYATVEDLVGLPPCRVVVNEFDPFRDEGIGFAKKCMEAGVCAEYECIGKSIHGIGSYLVNLCPEISQMQAKQIATFPLSHPLFAFLVPAL